MELIPDNDNYDRNVFQIAHEKATVPFFVRAYHWKGDSYFQVIAVRYTKKQMDYFEKKGKLYGTAEGYFYRGGQRHTGKVEELKNAGVYKWREVLEEDLARFIPIRLSPALVVV